jgi:hypothetical protein
MRAMGPGSVSSLLKIALDVVYYLLWICVAVSLIVAVAVLIFPLDPNLVATAREGDALTQVKLTGPLLASWFFTGSVYCAVLVVIVSRLRRIFATLTAGDPFHPTNVLRLRVIGLCLAGLVGLNVLVRLLFGWLMPKVALPGGGWFDPTAWFSVLVVFVLAEVFREGARLRREAELTI